MTIPVQIDTYISSQPEPKRTELQALHDLVLQVSPACQLWFSDGKNSDGKVIANPNIGYGCYTIQYADGTSREFYQIGLSANTTGISVYVMGIKDKTYLAATFGDTIGKASVTGYCIKFKTLKHINLDVLEEAIRLSISWKSKNPWNHGSDSVSHARYPPSSQCFIWQNKRSLPDM